MRAIIRLYGNIIMIIDTTAISKADKVRMYEEMMTNDDNLESNLLTSSLLKIHSPGCQVIGRLKNIGL